MRQGLRHLLTVCIAIHRHLTRTAVTTSALMLFTTSGCIPIEPEPQTEIIVNDFPEPDGAYEWEDCDDNNPEVGAPVEGEACTPPPEDCDDELGCDIIVNPAPDADEDGVYEWDDCDDNDPEVGAPAEGEECEPPPPPACEDDPDCEIISNPIPDGDGDGVAEWDDCDDNDPEVGAPVEGEECMPPPPPECEDDPDCDIIVNPAPDADEDGIPEWDDCDDTNPEIGAPAEGEECEPAPPPDCEDDPDCDIIVNPAPDADGDGVPEWDDCDDMNPEIGAPEEGEECDSVRPPECEDDPDCGIIVNPAPDADRDGVPDWEDCDDMNPRIGAPPEGEECDSVLPPECDDDPDCGIIVNPVPDEDGDGVPAWEDCDDMNPRVGAAPEGQMCPPPPVDE